MADSVSNHRLEGGAVDSNAAAEAERAPAQHPFAVTEGGHSGGKGVGEVGAFPGGGTFLPSPLIMESIRNIPWGHSVFRPGSGLGCSVENVNSALPVMPPGLMVQRSSQQQRYKDAA